MATFQVNAHATIDYSSADALFPDLVGAEPPAWSGSSAALRGAAPMSFDVDGGTIEYLQADDFLEGDVGRGPPTGAFDATTARVNAGGWRDAGPGRAEGSGLQLRRSLSDVLVVVFSTIAYRNLQERFDASDEGFLSIAGLRRLRRKYKNVTYAALLGRAWALAPSGAIGVVLKFGGRGPRNAQGHHEILVVTASLTCEGDIVSACSAEERCLGASGCSMRAAIVRALEEVLAAMQVTRADLFTVLHASVKTRRLQAGRGVLYGDKVCVVRNGQTSWPFSAVRQTRGGSWICLSCRTGDGTCDHAAAAVAAAKAEADLECDDSSDSDIEEEDEGDEARLEMLAGLRDAANDEATGAAQPPPHLPLSTHPLQPVNRWKWRARCGINDVG